MSDVAYTMRLTLTREFEVTTCFGTLDQRQVVFVPRPVWEAQGSPQSIEVEVRPQA